MQERPRDYGVGALVHMISVLPPGRRQGLEIEFNHVANQSCVCNKTVIKLWPPKLSGASWLGNTLMCQRVSILILQGENTEALSSSQNSPYMSCENEENECSFIRECALKPVESALTPGG